MATASNMTVRGRPDYGIDAPKVLRNLLLFGALAVLLALITPVQLHLGFVTLLPHGMFWSIGICLLVEGLLYLFYVKVGKRYHRDKLLALHSWSGDERVLDVGCGRGLLLAGAAKRLPSGHATGIDIWSTEDMAGNSEAATNRNLALEGVTDRCSLVSASAQEMPFASASFDVVVSNLCLHNIYDRAVRQKAVEEIARVLRPGGVALLSDYKHTSEYAAQLAHLGFSVERRWGSLTAFPPLRIVVARKPAPR
jgi:SAM-dependent methyltransferase